jgi:hypothetical protein
MWNGTRVALEEGHVGGKMSVPIQFLDYFIERATKLHALHRGRPARQKEKVLKEFRANMDRLAASGTIRAVDADVRRFGMDRVFPPDEDVEAK